MTENKKTILIVEDDIPMLEALNDKFTKEGFDILEAKNGIEGLNMSFDKHPDLILLDIIMPKMDGMTMLKKLRENEWGKAVPVILLTNLSSSEKATEAMVKGVYDYLVKADWTLEEVVDKVKEHLRI